MPHSPMIDVAEAIARVLRFTPGPPPPRTERVPLAAAVGRVLAATLRAEIDLPPFPRSTVDGYAVGPEDGVAGARLRVIGESAAGRPFTGALGPGTAVRIFTGARLPEVAAGRERPGVVMVEDSDADGEFVALRAGARAGQNVSPRGEDRRAGDLVLAAGKRLGVGDVAMLASLGIVELEVVEPVRAAILPTGSELLGPREPLRDGCIRESNSAMLAALVRACGARPVELGIVTDDREAIRRAAASGLECEVLLLSGGSSVGEYDFTPEVLADLGVSVHFDRVALKPGKPTLFGTRADRVVFGLPGNPISAFVTFHLFVRPALVALAGGPRCAPPRLAARLAAGVKRARERDQALPASLKLEGGEIVAAFTGWHGSGDVTCISGADALVLVPRGEGLLEAGARCEVTPIDSGVLGAYSLSIAT